MIVENRDNLLLIENEGGRLTIERDLENGLTMYLHNPLIALSMEGVFSREELISLTINWEYTRIRNTHQSTHNGCKKILETIVASDINDPIQRFSITFISEDTTYSYDLKSEEWNELMTLCSLVIEK